MKTSVVQQDPYNPISTEGARSHASRGGTSVSAEAGAALGDGIHPRATAARERRRISVRGGREMLDSAFSRHAGPLALAAGLLFIVAQLVMLPFDPSDHVATSTDPVFRAGGVLYFVGFCTLMLALVGAYGWGLHKAQGKLGVIAFGTALVGTMLLGGDQWFESFAVPWLADEAPAALFDTDPSTLLAIGAISSYLLFALGWALFGLANYRARVFPTAICIAIVIGGVIGFRALLSPTGIPLGIAVAWLGIWMIRTTRKDPLGASDQAS